MSTDVPPAYAWDWLARQRVVWPEIRRRLAAERPPPQRTRRPAGDVPDWSMQHPDVTTVHPAPSPAGGGPRDYRALGTRAEVIAALRVDYAVDASTRRIVDAVVGEVSFLGRLDASLPELGVRSAPRGMRWWWSHLTGRPAPAAPSAAGSSSEHPPTVPLQLRLIDVLAGYGDAMER
jgi:hypothetical protein